MFKRILVPLDLSPLAEQVLPVVKLIAQGLHSTVVLLHAVEPIQELVPVSADVFEPEEQLDIIRARVSNYLQMLKEEFLARDVKCELQTRVGQPDHAILDFAECEGIDLIAMTTHGRSGLQRWAHGSVAGRVLSHTRVPLLLVRAQAEANITPPLLTRILVPLDRSGFAEEALPLAQSLAHAFDAEIALFHVWDYSGYMFDESNDKDIKRIMRDTYGYAQQYMEEQAFKLQGEGLRVRWQMQSGPVANRIVYAAEHDGVDLVVMSSHGRSGLRRTALGSTADRVLCTARVPVLLIHAAEREARQTQMAKHG